MTTMKINGQRIDPEIIKKELSRIKNNYRGRLSEDEMRQIEKDLIFLAQDNVITRFILEQEADMDEPDIPFTEIRKEYEKMQNHFGGKEAFLKKINATGQKETDIKQNIEKSLKVNRLIEKIITESEKSDHKQETDTGDRIKEEEIKKYYEENYQHLKIHTNWRVYHIFFNETNQNQSQSENLNRLLMFKTEINSKDSDKLRFKKFCELAEKHSRCPSRENGGDLGYLQKNESGDDLFDRGCIDAPLYEAYGPVKSFKGLHLIFVTEKSNPQPAAFAETEKSIEKELFHKKRNEKIKSWIEKKKKSYLIEISNEEHVT